MPNKTRSENSTLSALIAITAVSSCLMLGAVGTYRLTVGKNELHKEKISEDGKISETDAERETPSSFLHH